VPYPAHQVVCATNNGNGEFFDNSLFINCGTSYAHYDSTGKMTGSSSSMFTITLTQ
jgi:hypothetical protein